MREEYGLQGSGLYQTALLHSIHQVRTGLAYSFPSVHYSSQQNNLRLRIILYPHTHLQYLVAVVSSMPHAPVQTVLILTHTMFITRRPGISALVAYAQPTCIRVVRYL